MKKVYILQHIHEINNIEDVKIIGIFSTKRKAEAAKNRTKKLKGFTKAQKGFHISDYTLDQDYWNEGFVTAKE